MLASELARGLRAHEDAYREYRAGNVVPSPVPSADPAAYLGTLTTELVSFVERLDQLLSPASVGTAMGAPGEEGDEAEIRRLAGRLADLYGEMIDWGAKVRGAQIGEPWLPVFVATSQYVDAPIDEFRGFSSQLTARVQGLVHDIRAGQPPTEPPEFGFTISLDPKAVDEFRSAIARFERGGSRRRRAGE